MTHTLKIAFFKDNVPVEQRDALRNYYNNRQNYEKDSGLDIKFYRNQTLSINRVTKVGCGICCQMYRDGTNERMAYYLLPRSSIANTPLMLANSVGIIDADYTGEIIAALRCYDDFGHPSTIHNHSYEIGCETSLLQIVAPDLKPLRVEFVDELDDVSNGRGEGGFGSTNLV
jgi:dUTP pyrophosphatase